MAKKAKRRGRPPGSKNQKSIGKSVATMDMVQLRAHIDNLQGVLAKKVKDMGFDELLVITDEVDEKLALSSRNLANVAIIPARHANPVALVRSKNVLITKAAVAKLEEMLK